MGKTADIFTLKAQFNPWGSIFDAEKSHADELSDSFSKDLGTT